MSTKPVILVTGATGAEGASIVKHLLKQGKFAVRALTRNPSSVSAKYLAAIGASIVEGNLNDLNSLKKAMDGCYGVYGFSDFRTDAELEYDHGMNLLKAVSKSNIQHFVLSTLPNVSRISKGRLPVPHFDIKAELEEHARSLNLNATFLHIAFYYEHLMSFAAPKKSINGNYYFGFPQGNTKLSAVSVEDVGAIVSTIFEKPFEFIGRIVGIVGEDITCDEYAQILSDVLGKTIKYRHIPREIFATSGFPGSEAIANMFEFNSIHMGSREADLKESLKLYPGLKGFETWVRKNVSKIESVFVEEPAEIFV